MKNRDLPLDSNLKLAKYVWPGGYPLFYLTKRGDCLCPDCAQVSIDSSHEDVVIIADTNWEDNELYCDDCNNRIPSAYNEEFHHIPTKE